MKKFLSVILALGIIFTVSGCNKDKNPEETTEGGSGEQVFEVGGKEDTTDEAVVYLSEKVPYFAKYLEKRMGIPLTYEIEAGSAKAGIYIMDESKVCHYSMDEAGNSSATIYYDDKIYYIDHAAKIVYEGDVTVDASKAMVENYRLRIDVDDAKVNAYNSYEEEYEGVTYKYETIATPAGDVTEYYYDMNSGDLVYIVSGGQVNKVTALTDKVDEKHFEIPEDYERSTTAELYASQG